MDLQVSSKNASCLESSRLSLSVLFDGCSISFFKSVFCSLLVVDLQELKYRIQMRSAKPSSLTVGNDSGKRLFLEPQHPIRWRRKQGHTLCKNADWLAEFDIVGLNAYRDYVGPNQSTARYTVSVAIARDPCNVVSNVVIAQLATSLIGSLSFFIDGFHDAVALVITALLTSVAFKLNLAEQLPNMPKPTAVEIYMLVSFGIFLFQVCFMANAVAVFRANSLSNVQAVCNLIILMLKQNYLNSESGGLSFVV